MKFEHQRGKKLQIKERHLTERQKKEKQTLRERFKKYVPTFSSFRQREELAM
jgi:hypothetical protein